jgi:predicted MPP superfamily phosphohydrolase
VPLSSLRRLYHRTGVHLLVNEHIRLPAGPTVIGTEDSVTRHYDLHRALRGLAATPVQLHLTHAPEVLDWPDQGRRVFTLSLAGHTHGGQIRLPGLPPVVPRGSGVRFVAGWYPTTTLGPAYVSRGIGTTLVPLRFHCPPELPILRLTRV